MASPRRLDDRYQRLELPSDPASVQAANKMRWNGSRDAQRAQFFTVSYTGRSLETICDLLGAAGVATLIDIRFAPVSMYRPETAKSNLSRFLTGEGIEYVHLPDLGVPRDVRIKAVESGNRQAIWTWYDEHVAQQFAGGNLDRFFNIAQHPIAFMCVEVDPTACHRHRLALALETRGLRGFDL
jgi:uncharacterized protein (DUF488 family)